MNLQLTDHTVLITGGSGAIGQAIATTYAHEGARVAITYHQNTEAATGLQRDLEELGAKATAIRLDQTQRGRASAAVAAVEEQLGPVTTVVANAVQWPDRTADEIPGLTASLEANTIGTLELVDATLAGMRARGHGRIVVMSTDVVEQPFPGKYSYVTAKGALEVAARILAVREARHDILTNVVRPGFTLTDRALSTPGLGQPAIDREGGRTPTGRICTPEDVASLTVYLGSPANGHVNGQVISVAGGRELMR